MEYQLLMVAVNTLERVGGEKSTGRGWAEMRVTHCRWKGPRSPWVDATLENPLHSFEESQWYDLMEMAREDMRQS